MLHYVHISCNMSFAFYSILRLEQPKRSLIAKPFYATVKFVFAKLININDGNCNSKIYAFHCFIKLFIFF